MTAPVFEYEPEAYHFDGDSTEEWPDYEPESRSSRRGPMYRPTVGPPRTRPSQYVSGPAAPGTVSRAELTRALQRVASDIDRLKGGARATTTQLNDLADRTGRAFRNVQAGQTQQAQRFDRGLSSTRELAVLGALLSGGGGSGSKNLLLLLLLADPSMSGGGSTPDGQANGGYGGGGMLSGSNGLLLVLALSGGLK
ncbi:hypothetical protein ACFY36_35795 [Actinoplanes sp. NPDC000266]